MDGGKADRSDSDNESDVEPPEREADSDDDDFFDMKPATKDTLSKDYLGSPRMQWVIAADNLADEGTDLHGWPLRQLAPAWAQRNYASKLLKYRLPVNSKLLIYVFIRIL